MSADHRLSAFGVGSVEVKRVPLERAWMGALRSCGFAMRTADVGESVLVMVLALTKVELTRVNEAARSSVDERTRRCCDAVEELLHWVGEPNYFSPWFVVESVDID